MSVSKNDPQSGQRAKSGRYRTVAGGRTIYPLASPLALRKDSASGNPFFLLAGSLADACPLRARVNARSRIQERGFRGLGSL